METSTYTSSPGSNSQLNTNNPYRQQDSAQNVSAPEVDTAKELQRPLDSGKEIVPHEQQSPNDVNSPIVVSPVSPIQPTIEATREAPKEVTRSWQTMSQEQSGLILRDEKEPPPAYEDSPGRAQTQHPYASTTPTTIEPDGTDDNLPPRAEDRSAVGQPLSWIPPAPSRNAIQMQPLLQPIVIPQLDVPPKGESVPFMRCYSDALSLHGVSMREFTSFLDGLALAQAPNSALQGLKLFGAGVASIPLPFIGLAGKGISALAASGSGHSGSRARLYLERVKKEYFEPRGLRLSIVKDADLNPRLQMPTHAYRLAPLTNSTLTENTSKRRMESLAPYVAPLRYDVPEQDQQVQGVHKLARKHLESQFKGQATTLRGMRERQWHSISHALVGGSGWDDRYMAKMAELRSLQMEIIRVQQPEQGMSGTLREMMQALDQLQKDVQVLVSERQTGMQNAIDAEKGVEAEMKEISWCSRLKWIVIENL